MSSTRADFVVAILPTRAIDHLLFQNPESFGVLDLGRIGEREYICFGAIIPPFLAASNSVQIRPWFVFV